MTRPVYVSMYIQIGYGRGSYEGLEEYSTSYGISDCPEHQLAKHTSDVVSSIVINTLNLKNKWSKPMDRFGVLAETLNCPREHVERIARALGYDSRS